MRASICLDFAIFIAKHKRVDGFNESVSAQRVPSYFGAEIHLLPLFYNLRTCECRSSIGWLSPISFKSRFVGIS